MISPPIQVLPVPNSCRVRLSQSAMFDWVECGRTLDVEDGVCRKCKQRLDGWEELCLTRLRHGTKPDAVPSVKKLGGRRGPSGWGKGKAFSRG